MGGGVLKPHWRWVVGAALSALIVTGIVLLKTDGLATGLQLKPEPPPVKVASDNAALGLQQAFIHVAAAVGPSVVNISAEWTEKVPGMEQYGSMDDFFNYWFFGPGGPPGGMRRRAPDQFRKERSLGSGFIITQDGYVLTNAHVLGKATKVTVTLQDGRDFKGTVVGRDEKTDIGLVKIDAAKLPYAVLGDSDAIEVGQWSIAIGNPFALDHTVTTGVISAKGRTVALNERSPYQSYIQTDASINPGNSGGPLCNIAGEVVGINTAIYSQTGGSVGIGFAIPVNVAKKVAHDLANKGRVVRAGLGATVQSLDYKMAKSFGLDSTEGALIASVNPGSAAEKGGLKAGDIVLEMDGAPVRSAAEMIAKLYTKSSGDTVKLTVLRESKRYKFEVALQALDEAPAAKREEPQEPARVARAADDLGLSVQDQTPEIRAQMPPGAPRGPVVMNVQRGSPAAAAGLSMGDVILKVGERPVANVAELSRALKANNLREGVRLFVWSDGTTGFSFLQAGE
jgi:serine protease Do